MQVIVVPHNPDASSLYGLSQHVFLCVAGDQVVLLDLKADQYFALEWSSAAGIAAYVRGWPIAPLTGEDDMQVKPWDITHALLRRRLLSADLVTGKAATPIHIPRPTRELVPDGHGEHSRVRVGHAAAFLAAALRAALMLRCWSLEHVITRVRRRKKFAANSRSIFDALAARQAIVTFRTLNPWCFSARNKCLLTSLALLEFWPRGTLVPTWVFGVKTRPFAAHCWLQHEDMVLNDTLDHVESYTPIMAV